MIFKIKYIKIVQVFCFTLFLSYIKAQEVSEFQPVEIDSSKGLRLYGISDNIINKKIENYSGEHKKEYKEIWEENKTDLKSEYFKHIYFNNKFQEYIQNIVNTILEANPSLSNNIRVFFKLDPEMNACNTGENSMFINLGLLSGLEKESELAFIIGHEMAHHYLDHMSQSIDEYYAVMYSEETQHEIKSLKGIDKLNKLIDLKRSLGFKNSKHSRFKEAQADSFSIELLKNTKYNLQNAIVGIERLKYNDTDRFEMNQTLREKFNFENYPFQDKWIYKKESMGDRMKYTLSKEIKDSLLTHPETDIRYKILQERVISEQNSNNQEINTELFNEMKQEFRLQTIYSLVKLNKVSEAMYWILKFESEGYKHVFLNKMMHTCLENIYKSFDNHNLESIIQTRNPFFMPEYNKLLIFIDNLNFKDLEILKQEFKLKYNI